MNFTSKLNAEIASFTQNMKNGVDNCKLDGKIAEQQRKIKMLEREIGNLVLLRLDAGDEMSPEIMERYSAIREIRTEIEALEKERKTTRAICPKCGAVTSVDMNYCGKCGSNMTESGEEAQEADGQA